MARSQEQPSNNEDSGGVVNARKSATKQKRSLNDQQALFDLCGPEIDKFPCLFAQKDHLVTAVWQRVQEKHPNVPFQDKDDAMNFLEGHVKCWNGAKGAAARSVASEIHSKLCAYRYIKTENSGFLLRCHRDSRNGTKHPKLSSAPSATGGSGESSAAAAIRGLRSPGVGLGTSIEEDKWNSTVIALCVEESVKSFCPVFINREKAIHEIIRTIVLNMNRSSPDKRQQEVLVLGLMWGSGKTALGREFCRLINQKPEQYLLPMETNSHEQIRCVQRVIYCYSSYPDTGKAVYGRNTSVLVQWEDELSSRGRAKLHLAAMLVNAAIWPVSGRPQGNEKDNSMVYCLGNQERDKFHHQALLIIADDTKSCEDIGKLFLEQVVEDRDLHQHMFPSPNQWNQCTVLLHFDEIAGMVVRWGLYAFLDFWREFAVRCVYKGFQINFTLMFSSKEEDVRQVYIDKETQVNRTSPSRVKHLILVLFGISNVEELLHVSKDTATKIFRLTAGVPRLVDNCRGIVTDRNVALPTIKEALQVDVNQIHEYLCRLKTGSRASLFGFLLFLAETRVPIPYGASVGPALKQCIRRNNYTFLNVHLDEYEENSRLITEAKRFCFYVDSAEAKQEYAVLVFPEIVLQDIHTVFGATTVFLRFVTDYRMGKLRPHQLEVLVPAAIWIRFAMLDDPTKWEDVIPSFEGTVLGQQPARCFKIRRTFKFTSPKFDARTKSNRGKPRSLSNQDVRNEWCNTISADVDIEKLTNFAGADKCVDRNLMGTLVSTDKPAFHELLAPDEYYVPAPGSHGQAQRTS